MERQLDPDAAASIIFVWGERETDDDTRTTTPSTRATVEYDDDDELYDDDDDDGPDALSCFPARRPLPRALSLARSNLDHRARPTSPSTSTPPVFRTNFSAS